MNDSLTAVEQIQSAMIEHGLTPPSEIQISGTVKRFKSGHGSRSNKNGWYRFALNDDGSTYGRFGCYASGIDEPFKELSSHRYSPDEAKAHAKSIAERRAQQEADEKAKHSAAAKIAQRVWDNATPAKDHPYLTKKGVNPHGSRVAKDGRLIIPRYNRNGELRTLQYINQQGEKRYLTGGEINATHWVIGEPVNGEKLFLAEGFATAASIHEAEENNAACFVAFDAGNLSAVAAHIRSAYPECSLVIVVDNDDPSKAYPLGTGQTLSTKAAIESNALLVIPPRFEDGKKLDSNDYAIAGGDLTELLKKPIQPTPDTNNKLQSITFSEPQEIWGYRNLEDKSQATIEQRIFNKADQNFWLPGRAYPYSAFEKRLKEVFNEELEAIKPNQRDIARAEREAVMWAYLREKTTPESISEVFGFESEKSARRLKEVEKFLRGKHKGESFGRYTATDGPEIASYNTPQKVVDDIVENLEEAAQSVISGTYLEPTPPKKIVDQSIWVRAFDYVKQKRAASSEVASDLIKLSPELYGFHYHLKHENGFIPWNKSVKKIAKTQEVKAVFVKSQHGTGKNEGFLKAISDVEDFDNILMVLHRVSLCKAAANTLGFELYNSELTSEKAQLNVQSPKLVTCLNSLLSNNVVKTTSSIKRAVFVDEFTQVMNHMVSGEFTDKDKGEIFEAFKAVLRGSELAVFTDADTNDHMIKAYCEMAGIEPHQVMVITTEPPKRELTVNLQIERKISTVKEIISGAIRSESPKESPVIVFFESVTGLQGCKTTLEAKELEAMEEAEAEAEANNLKVIKITGSGKVTLTDKEEELKQRFMSNPTAFVEEEKPDLLLLSSAAMTGISINDQGQHFKRGYAVVFGHVCTGLDVIQVTRRCRYLKLYNVIIARNNTSQHFISDNKFKGLDTSSIDSLLNNGKTLKQYQDNYFLDVLEVALKGYGVQVVWVFEPTEKQPAIKSKEVLQGEAKRILKASVVVFGTCLRKVIENPSSEEEILHNRKIEIQQLLGVENIHDLSEEQIYIFLSDERKARLNALLSGRTAPQLGRERDTEVARDLYKYLSIELHNLVESESLDASRSFMQGLETHREALVRIDALQGYWCRKIPATRNTRKRVIDLAEHWGVIDNSKATALTSVAKQKEEKLTKRQELDTLMREVGTLSDKGYGKKKIAKELGIDINQAYRLISKWKGFKNERKLHASYSGLKLLSENEPLSNSHITTAYNNSSPIKRDLLPMPTYEEPKLARISASYILASEKKIPFITTSSTLYDQFIKKAMTQCPPNWEVIGISDIKGIGTEGEWLKHWVNVDMMTQVIKNVLRIGQKALKQEFFLKLALSAVPANDVPAFKEKIQEFADMNLESLDIDVMKYQRFFNMVCDRFKQQNIA